MTRRKRLDEQEARLATWEERLRRDQVAVTERAQADEKRRSEEWAKIEAARKEAKEREESLKAVERDAEVGAALRTLARALGRELVEGAAGGGEDGKDGWRRAPLARFFFGPGPWGPW